MKRAQIRWSGAVLVACFVVAVHALFALWPAVDVPPDQTTVPSVEFFDRFDWQPTTGTALLALVGVAGVLGSLIYTANSFARHVGARTFGATWQWWYVLRPLIGGALAIAAYWLARAQLLGIDGSSNDINPYGVAGVAALIGLFSRQAVEKLNEVFNTLFATRGEDTAVNLTVGSLEPTTVPSAQAATIVIHGSGFDATTTATVNGQAVDVTLQDATTLSVAVPASTLPAPGEADVTLTNPSGASASASLTVS